MRTRTRRGWSPTRAGSRWPPILADNDIVVNCVLQDPTAPWTFLRTRTSTLFRPGSLIVDVSCDEGMGFSWARPTSFEDPTFVVGNTRPTTPSTTRRPTCGTRRRWVNSEAILPHLRTVLSGPEAWAKDQTSARAIEIQDGEIRNPAILPSRAAERPFPMHDPAR